MPPGGSRLLLGRAPSTWVEYPTIREFLQPFEFTEADLISISYGMTSLSVRQYVVGIYEYLGLDEKDITKVQTGGPDGDLGSSTCFSLGVQRIKLT